MKPRPHLQTKDKSRVGSGTLLVAQPFWNEEIYRHSVIIIIERKRSGAIGIIINKNSNVKVHDALPELNISETLYFGGPSNTKMVSFMHNNADVPGAVYIDDHLFLGGDYEFMKELINNKRFDLSQVRFYAGFVNWGKGELENEIRENKWWVTGINANELFGVEMDELWAFKLFSEGHIYGMFSEVPDPSLN